MRALLVVAALSVSGCVSTPVTVKTPAPVTKEVLWPKWERTEPPATLTPVPNRNPRVSMESLPNGLQVVIVELHRRPVASVRLVFPNGTAADPQKKLGLTWMSVALAGERREESTPFENAVETALRWDVLEAGGRFTFGATADTSHVGIDGYASDVTKYLETLSDAVKEPRHGPRSFEGRRRALIELLANVELNDAEAFSEVLKRAAFGETHPYGRSDLGDRATLSGLTLKDVTARQSAIFRPWGATLLVVGDVNPVDVISGARRLFGRWSAPRPDAAKIGALAMTGTSVLSLERRPAFTTGICMTRPIADGAASEAALDLLAAIAGRSRLTESLREERTLTYSAFAANVRRRYGHAFVACSRLRASESAQGLSLFLDAMKRLHAEGPTEAELERARSELISELRGRHDTTADLTSYWMHVLDQGAAPHVQPRIDALDAVTVEELGRLAHSLLDPGQLRVVVWGDPKRTAPAIASAGLGEPELVKLQSIVGPEAEIAPAETAADEP